MTRIEGVRKLPLVVALAAAGATVGACTTNNYYGETPRASAAGGQLNPTEAPTLVATATPGATEATQLTPEQIKAAHEARLRSLDSIYRTQGPEAWAAAAGFSWTDILVKDARQPEEETLSDGTIVVAGLQVKVEGLRSPWTNIFTTDEPVNLGPDGRSYQPDPNNPSRLYTDTNPFTGDATLWADGSNWQQLAPKS